jgi:hypothetical protein
LKETTRGGKVGEIIGAKTFLIESIGDRRARRDLGERTVWGLDPEVRGHQRGDAVEKCDAIAPRNPITASHEPACHVDATDLETKLPIRERNQFPFDDLRRPRAPGRVRERSPRRVGAARCELEHPRVGDNLQIGQSA